MANTLDELIQAQKKLYNYLSDPQEKLIVKNYLEGLKKQKRNLDFVNDLLDIVKQKTNQELDELNMRDFMYYLNNKDSYFREYQHAKAIFMRHLEELLRKMVIEIIKGLEEA